jgi:deoxyribose-phosphate aldolase
LKPDASRTDVERVCQEALECGFFSVCINPYWVPFAFAVVGGSAVKICTVAGFPLGASTTASKQVEAQQAIRAGAEEIDMVLNVGALLSGDERSVETDIAAVAEVCRAEGAGLKVILETALLNDTQKRTACRIAMTCGADFVKTSTGFAAKGATVEDVTLMRAAVGHHMGVKASGGIRTLADLERMVAAGASRIGASASVAIFREFNERQSP